MGKLFGGISISDVSNIRFRLKKDLPGLKAGAIFVYYGASSLTVSICNYYAPAENGHDLPTYRFAQKHLEDNPEWFERIGLQKGCKLCKSTIEDRGAEYEIVIRSPYTYDNTRTVCVKCADIIKKLFN